MNTAIVIQARMGSTRLPGKVLLPLTAERTVLDWVIERVRQNRVVKDIVLATTTAAHDDILEEYANRNGISLYRGSETDVLARYLGAADRFGLEALVRITADCPLIEPTLIDAVIRRGMNSGADYVSTEGYPRGSGDAEFVTVRALCSAEANAGETEYYHEHVTTYLLDHPTQFQIEILHPRADEMRLDVRLTIDESADLELVRQICEHFAPRIDFTLLEILDFLDTHPTLAHLNAHV